MILSSESKDMPLILPPEQEYSESLFPLVSMTMTLPYVVYATFLPQNDEQMKGVYPDLLHGKLNFIVKSPHRNETDVSLAVKKPSMVLAIPRTSPST